MAPSSLRHVRGKRSFAHGSLNLFEYCHCTVVFPSKMPAYLSEKPCIRSNYLALFFSLRIITFLDRPCMGATTVSLVAFAPCKQCSDLQLRNLCSASRMASTAVPNIVNMAKNCDKT